MSSIWVSLVVFWAPKVLGSFMALTFPSLAYTAHFLGSAHSTVYLMLFLVVVSLSDMPGSPLLRPHLLQWTPGPSSRTPTMLASYCELFNPEFSKAASSPVTFPDISQCQVSTVHHDRFNPVLPYCPKKNHMKDSC